MSTENRICVFLVEIHLTIILKVFLGLGLDHEILQGPSLNQGSLGAVCDVMNGFNTTVFIFVRIQKALVDAGLLQVFFRGLNEIKTSLPLYLQFGSYKYPYGPKVPVDVENISEVRFREKRKKASSP